MTHRRDRVARQIRAVLREEDIPVIEGGGESSSPVHDSLGFTTSDGIKYLVYFWKEEDEEFPNLWSASFSAKNEVDSKKPFEVIQNVAGALRSFIQEHNPSYLYMSPTSPSRKKLYQTMFRRFLPGSEVVLDGDGLDMIYSIPGGEI